MAEPLSHVTPGQPFQPTAKFHNRTVDTIRWVDEQRVIFEQGPLAAEAVDLFRRVYITQVNDDGDSIPFYSAIAGGPDEILCNTEPDGSGRDYTVHWYYPPGVRFSGEAIYIARRKEPDGLSTYWQVIDSGVSVWPLATGGVGQGTDNTVTLFYRDYRYAPGVDGGFCVVPAILFDSTFNVIDDSQVYVAFDQVTGQFVVCHATCPPAT